MSIVKQFICLLSIYVLVSGPLFGQSDVSKLIELIGQDKLTALAEVKQLREKNSQDRQRSGFFDFGYGLMALNLGHEKEAIEALQPFVELRPGNFRAQFLLIRAQIQQEQFDQVILQAEKLLDHFPTEADSAERVAAFVGTLVGFVSFASPDFTYEQKKRLEKLAQTKIPESFRDIYRESVTFVESRFAELSKEIEQAVDDTDSKLEQKSTNTKAEADKLRAQIGNELDELKKRETAREKEMTVLQTSIQDLGNQYDGASAALNRLGNEIGNLRHAQARLEREKTRTERDKNGNETKKTTIEITNEREHRRLGSLISQARTNQQNLERRLTAIAQQRQNVVGQLAGLSNQQQLDQVNTNGRVSKLNKLADGKEKKADREADQIGKLGSTQRALTYKQQSFSTYCPLDVARDSEYLQQLAKRFLSK